MQKTTINDIITRKLFGEPLTEEELDLLNARLKDESFKRKYDELMNESGAEIAKRYREYSMLNGVSGEQKQGISLTFNPEPSSPIPADAPTRSLSPLTSNLLKYAAAILVLLVAGAGIWYSQYTKVTPPEISEAVQLAMQQSIQSGKQEAEVFGVSGEKLEVRGEKIRGERIESGAGKQEQDISLTSHPSPLTPENLSSLTKDQLLAAKRITTKHDKEFWLTLDDGTLVHLNYNTRLIYPEKFGRGDRNVILDGEAYFMVAKDKSRPFIVHTPNGDVKVYGTEFNVNTRTEVRGKKIRGERIESSTGEHNQDKSLTSHLPPLTSTSVVLVKGSVSVTPTGGKETMLKPGQQATVNGQSSMANGQWSTVNGQSSMIKVENVDVEPYVAWNIGKFSFKDIELERVINVISKWYGIHIDFASEEIKSRKIIGYFDRYEPLDNTLRAITMSVGLRLRHQGESIIIEK
ncbi:MAG: FecR domain-containing protein [Prevotella sp.]|nr:FecR domain-containing protein [Prevotella sp.]